MKDGSHLISCFINLVEQLQTFELLDIASDVESIVERNVERLASSYDQSVVLSTRTLQGHMNGFTPSGFLVINGPHHVEFISRDEAPKMATLRVVATNHVSNTI